MAVAAHLWFDSNPRYGWAIPGTNSLCKYMNIYGKEVAVDSVSNSETISGLNHPKIVCLGEVICCIANVFGVRYGTPAHVQSWLASVYGPYIPNGGLVPAPVPAPNSPNSVLVWSGELSGQIITTQSLRTTGMQEAPCKVITCRKNNDIGVKTCWNCGCSDPA